MKVVVAGGYGVFGSFLSELLVRDGHEVWICGRNLKKARTLALGIGARPLAIDATNDALSIFRVAPDVVIDAVGPFQHYDRDPYQLARLCLEHGVNYLDFSDSAAFTAGISVLDAKAKSADCWALSGASSVPGISSVIVSMLAHGVERILVIESAILPGNQAPRGRSVIASILSETGREAKIWRGGRWRDFRGWSSPRRYRLGGGLVRKGYVISVPDLVLFPNAFGAHSVLFRAGLELSVMNWSLVLFSRMRQALGIRPAGWFAAIVQSVSVLLLPFGSDRGGMHVSVIGVQAGRLVQKTWLLRASNGDGPYVPAVAARALLRRAPDIAPGARACIGEVESAEIQTAMSDLSIETESDWQDWRPLFHTVLREQWHQLPRESRILHSICDQESFSGTASIERGQSPIAGLIAWCFGFPRAGRNVPVEVIKTRDEHGEIWQRRFGDKVFRSHCSPSPKPGRLIERFGPFRFELDLPIDAGRMAFVIRCGWFMGLPLPDFLLPASDTAEYVEDGEFHFDVALHAPCGGGLIVRYRGHLTPDVANGIPDL